MMSGPKPESNAWNPGLGSEIPAELLSQVTLFNAENSSVSYSEALEAANFCGLKPQEMVDFKVSRLAMHEVLIRVTADLYVPDGPSYEELGLNLRSMADRILSDHVQPKMNDLEKELSSIRSEVEATLTAQLKNDIFERADTSSSSKNPSLIARFFGKKKSDEVPETQLPEFLALSEWKEAISNCDDQLVCACLKALHVVVGGIVGQRGRLMADTQLIVRLATNLVCNSYGSRRIGALIDPIFREGSDAEGFRRLPYQAEPFVMNVKGASAAGKSTLRPLQRELAIRLGIRWEDFALVSPDYWRKFLIDYDGLGENFKYAAMMTGQELEIIDKKLDMYMEAKAARGEMPHLLIDRFRFDSFESANNQKSDGRLLSRFGHTVFMFFVITPPVETVERAWKRGIKTGRYKAVDDLLYHNIEAYTGMPQLFLTWVNKKKQKVHFEFLDNDVPYGERPKTVAFGWNGQITIVNPACMRRLNSYRRINVEATRPEDVYLQATGAEDDILETFIEKIPKVAFIDPKSLSVRAQIENGTCTFEKEGFLEQAGLKRVPHADSTGGQNISEPHGLRDERKFTIGVLGGK